MKQGEERKEKREERVSKRKKKNFDNWENMIEIFVVSQPHSVEKNLIIKLSFHRKKKEGKPRRRKRRSKMKEWKLLALPHRIYNRKFIDNDRKSNIHYESVEERTFSSTVQGERLVMLIFCVRCETFFFLFPLPSLFYGFEATRERNIIIEMSLRSKRKKKKMKKKIKIRRNVKRGTGENEWESEKNFHVG